MIDGERGGDDSGLMFSKSANLSGQINFTYSETVYPLHLLSFSFDHFLNDPASLQFVTINNFC